VEFLHLIAYGSVQCVAIEALFKIDDIPSVAKSSFEEILDSFELVDF
jgi:hypothetical protein